MLNMRRPMYRYIGSGSGREVYDLGNGYVAKVAKNEAGIAQNKTEYRISSIDYSNLFAKVIEVSGDFNIIVMEKADKINSFSYILNYFNIRNISELFNIWEIQRIQYEYNLLGSDLRRKSSWGIINGKPTIIDYGFTREVKEIYYEYF